MTRSIKITRLSALLIAVIGVMLAYVFIVNPLVGAWNELDRRVEVVNLQYMRDTRTVDNFDDYVELYHTYEDIAAQKRSDEEELALFLKEIENFAGPLDVAINDIKPLPNEEEKHKNVFLLRLEMEGAIDELVSFLHTIASSDTLIRVETMSLQTTSRRNNILTAKITLSKTFLTD